MNSRNHSAIELARKEFGHRITQQNEEIRKWRAKCEKLELENEQYVKMGKDFEQMLKARQNPIVNDAWNKFMLALRMTE